MARAGGAKAFPEDAGIVDEHVNAAEQAHHLRHGGADALLAGHIELDSRWLEAFRRELGRRLAALGDVARGQHSHQTGARQLLDDLQPDAAVGTRDQSDACFGHGVS
jgi:hypothetical protein